MVVAADETPFRGMLAYLAFPDHLIVVGLECWLRVSLKVYDRSSMIFWERKTRLEVQEDNRGGGPRAHGGSGRRCDAPQHPANAPTAGCRYVPTPEK